MSCLLHLSDTHFGTERPSVMQALRNLVRVTAPELVVLSGDVTQRARSAQFDAAREFVASLGNMPVLVIPGNHDIPLFNLWARGFAPYAGFTRVFGHELAPRYESERWQVICVNTTRPHRHKHGEVSSSQVAEVAEHLKYGHPNQLKVVVTHQPISVIRESDLVNLLRGYEHALLTWAEAGADIVLGGHIHLPYVIALHELYPLPRRMWAVQAGTATSHRVRDGIPNSVNVLRPDPLATCCVQRWDYSTADHAFSLVQEHVLDLQRP